jgi:SNF2 family DNA or RNA helicase
VVIYTPRKAVILRTKTPSKITTLIPTAKEFSYKGKSGYVAIPHRPEETKVLQNMGYKVPAPMNYYYDYPGRFKPFEAQKATAEFASMNPRCFILNSMGLGKTITTLWALDYLRKLGIVHRALVICPISVMERTWADEIFRAFPDVTASVLYGSREKRLKLLAQPADIYIINTDALRIIKDEMAERPDIDIVIIDEVALFRNQTSARWGFANEICNKQCHGARRVWGLTGSPMPNLPTDAYGQIKLVTPGNPDCPKYFGRFRDLTMIQLTQYKWAPKPDAAQTVYRIMQPAIRFSLDDAVDLPPQIITERKVNLSKEQEKAYKQMLRELRSELAQGSILAVNEAVKASKLLQIACGLAYGEGDKEIPIPCKERLEAVDEVINESEGKSIVFVPFTAALGQLRDFLIKQGHSVAVVDGSTPKGERDEIFYNFQNREEPKVIIANPSTMSHGLTLTAATTIIWFGPTYSNEVYMQACARVRRPGQKRSTVIVHIVSTPLEESIYERLATKQSLQGLLLDMVRDNVDK